MITFTFYLDLFGLPEQSILISLAGLDCFGSYLALLLLFLADVVNIAKGCT